MVTSRILFTAKQKDELWERWKNGQSVLAISRALERRNKTGGQRIVALNGGIAPAPRCRAVAALKLKEREEISRGIAAGRSVRRIARGLKRSPSTISREIRRIVIERTAISRVSKSFRGDLQPGKVAMPRGPRSEKRPADVVIRRLSSVVCFLA